MTETIHKFLLMPIRSKQRVPMPQGSRILAVAEQSNHIALWAEVDTVRPEENRLFAVVWTGDPLAESGSPKKYLGTVQTGAFVHHVYELLNVVPD